MLLVRACCLGDGVPSASHSLLSTLLAAPVRERLPFSPYSWAQLAGAHPHLVKHSLSGQWSPEYVSDPGFSQTSSATDRYALEPCWPRLALAWSQALCPWLRHGRPLPASCSLGENFLSGRTLPHRNCPRGCLSGYFPQKKTK